jgi:hypothetical protein
MKRLTSSVPARIGESRFRWAAVLVAAALGTGAVGALWYLDQPSHPTAAPSGPGTGLARVVRTDLVTSQPVAGTIGYGATTTLVAAGGSSPQAVAQAQSAVGAATQKLAADRQAAADQAGVNQQSVAAAQAALSADQATLGADQQTQQADQQKQQQDCAASPAGQACATDQQKAQSDGARVAQDQARVQADQANVAVAQAQAQQRMDQANAQVGADQVALGSASQALQPVQSQLVHGTVYTGLPDVGSTISQGQALYSVDGHAVPLFYGAVAMYRVMAPGVSGPDVQQLEQDLVQLGFADPSNLSADGSFTAADAAVVSRWQASLGVARTGQVALGDLVFLPGPQRVAGVHLAVGGPVQGGQPILDLTPPTRVVTVQLNPSLAYSVKQGDAVTVDLPDGRTRIPGVVSAVSPVAQQVTGTTQTQNGAPQSYIPVTITPSNPAQVPPLDRAPVTVDVTTRSARNVLAVPVNALLALEGGGYAVEVPNPGGRGTHLVPVQTGIFDSSRVEVSGQGLSEGMTVVVPAS